MIEEKLLVVDSVGGGFFEENELSCLLFISNDEFMISDNDLGFGVSFRKGFSLGAISKPYKIDSLSFFLFYFFGDFSVISGVLSS